jgi:hypothetical protein
MPNSAKDDGRLSDIQAYATTGAIMAIPHRPSGSRLVEQFRDAGLRVLTTKLAVANARHWCNITGQCNEADALEFGAVCVSV